MRAKKYRAFWQGAVILTAASLVTKILSAFYRIPYQNIAGDIGFYIYQQVYPIYGFVLVLATYGFPSVISKLVAEKLEERKENEIHAMVSFIFTCLFVAGLLMFMLLFIGARPLALWMGDEKLDILLQVTAFSFLIMPFLSVARGYFQGFSDMVPTAVSQVIEQIIRVTIIVLFSFYLLSRGFDIYAVGAGAMFGSIAGGVVASIILLMFLQRRQSAGLSYSWHVQGKRGMIKTVLWQGIAVCVSNLAFILIQFVDSMTLYSMLVQGGEDVMAAKTIKGVYDRSIPLIQLGTVVATSFSLSLIPIIARARRRKNIELIQQHIQLAMRVTFVVGLAAAVGLIWIMRPANVMLFENTEGSDVLSLAVIAIVFSAIIITTASILQGLGHTAKPALFVGIGVCIKIGANMLLIPMIGAKGAAVATVAALALIALLNSVLLQRIIGQPIINHGSISYIALACIGMIICLTLYGKLFEYIFIPPSAEQRGLASIEALTSVAVGGACYLICIVKLRVFTKAEMGTVLQKQ